MATTSARAVPSAFTSGPVGRTLLAFSLPILASSVLQSLNASINAVWIGRLLGERALAASANANSVLFVLLGVVFGVGLAASVLVGQGIGAGNIDLAKRTVGTSVILFAAIALTVAAAGVVLTPRLLAAMRTPAEALPLASSYLRVIFVALPGMYLYTFVMMVLRGAGDSKTPFVFLALSATADALLNPLLIRGIGPVPPLGIAGSALATLLAQWTSLAGLVAWLYRKRHFLRITAGERRYLRVDMEILRALVAKGLPMGLQMIVMSSSMLAMISLVNRFGARTAAAYAACFQLWNYVQMPAVAIGSAVSSMAAQNVGANLWDRVARVARTGVVFNIVMTSALVLAITAIDRPAFALFLGDSRDAVDAACHIHRIVSWSFILFGVSFVLASVVRATGAVVAPLVILFVALWLVRIPFAYSLMASWGADALWWSFPLGSVVSLALSGAYYRFGGWRQARMLARTPVAPFSEGAAPKSTPLRTAPRPTPATARK